MVLVETKCLQVETFSGKLPKERENGQFLGCAVARLQVIGGRQVEQKGRLETGRQT
jgi:hypothetical protein